MDAARKTSPRDRKRVTRQPRRCRQASGITHPGRHSKTPTSSALAREPRRRLLSPALGIAPLRVRHSERTPSVPRCQYLRGAILAIGKPEEETASLGDEIDQHRHRQEEGEEEVQGQLVPP